MHLKRDVEIDIGRKRQIKGSCKRNSYLIFYFKFNPSLNAFPTTSPILQ